MRKFYNKLKILLELYPPILLLLIFIPILIGFVIDYDLSDSRYVIINLVWVLLFTVPYCLFHKKIFYQLAILIYFLVGFIEISHWIILKGPLTITSLLVLASTNYQESIEFLDLKATGGLFLLLPYLFIFIIAFKHSPKQNKKSNYHFYLIGIISLASCVFILENSINNRFIRKGTPQIVKVTLSFFDKINLYKEVLKKNTPRIVDAKTLENVKQQTVILIIGESCNKNHLSLYGAKRKTNPKLEKRGDIIAYNDIISPYSNTINSVLSILSQSNLENKLPFDKSIDIIDVFHSAGFKTYWISNQSPIGVWENLISVFAKKSDYTKFVNTTSNSSFEATLNTSYDSKLFKPLISVLNEKVNKKFIIIHLMGSHSSYSKRYPSNFNLFKGSNSKEETIAEYDNSILYNDFIIDSLLNIISIKKNDITSAIYLSDHGENVYDELDKVGHDYANTLPKANVEIPFLVWLSPAYRKLNPIKTTTIKRNKNKPFVSDDLFHTIMDLNNIKSPLLILPRSIFSDSFNADRKRILVDGKNYDEK